MVTELLQKYIWLTQTVIRAGRNGLTFKEITRKWENRYNEDYARRTFNNHREAILEVFGIDIHCDRRTNTYYVDADENGKILGGDAAGMIDTFTVNQLLTQSKNKLKGRVSVEEIPSGHIYLTGIMEAMMENATIWLSYRKYSSSEPSSYLLEPYAIKEFEKRWYIIGRCLQKDEEKRDDLRVFGLDRIQGLEETGKNFKMKSNFDVEEIFATSFGIYLPREKAKTIRFRSSKTEAHYINDLPLHRSQRIVAKDEQNVTFEIFAVPDRTMLMTFLKYGSGIEVLSPADVVESLRAEIGRMAALYGKDKN